jgi:hypothetical protein
VSVMHVIGAVLMLAREHSSRKEKQLPTEISIYSDNTEVDTTYHMSSACILTR